MQELQKPYPFFETAPALPPPDIDHQPLQPSRRDALKMAGKLTLVTAGSALADHLPSVLPPIEVPALDPSRYNETAVQADATLRDYFAIKSGNKAGMYKNRYP